MEKKRRAEDIGGQEKGEKKDGQPGTVGEGERTKKEGKEEGSQKNKKNSDACQMNNKYIPLTYANNFTRTGDVKNFRQKWALLHIIF